jgi:hypothetical protein
MDSSPTLSVQPDRGEIEVLVLAEGGERDGGRAPISRSSPWSKPLASREEISGPVARPPAHRATILPADCTRTCRDGIVAVLQDRHE